MALSTSRRKRAAACGVGGDDAIGVVRAVAVDVRDRLVEPGHGLHRQDRVQILGAPVLLGGRRGTRLERAHHLVAADGAAGGDQRCQHRRQQALGGVAVDQQRLGGAAHAGAAQLGVDRDRHRHGRIGAACR